MENDPAQVTVQFEPKRHHSVQATRLIHEHYGTVMAYVYSRAPLNQLVKDRFAGEWKYLHRALFELPEQQATRALIEVALYIRLVDDDEGRMGSQLRAGQVYGQLLRKDGSRVALSYRDVPNKIIHASHYEWLVDEESGDPVVMCGAGTDQSVRGYDWDVAIVNLVSLGAICGGLMS